MLGLAAGSKNQTFISIALLGLWLVIRLALRPTRLLVVLATVAGGVTLLLGGLGVYGVVAWGVSRRVRDIGVRVALGADRGRILRSEMGRVVRILALGAAVGVAGSWAASAGLRTLLYRVEPFDPASVAVALSVLVATGALAAWLPARRAARVDPVEALRAE